MKIFSNVVFLLTVLVRVCFVLSFLSLLYIGSTPKPNAMIPAALQDCSRATKTNDNDVIYYHYQCRFMDKDGYTHTKRYDKDIFEEMLNEPKGKEFMVKDDSLADYKIYIFFTFVISTFLMMLIFCGYPNINKRKEASQ